MAPRISSTPQIIVRDKNKAADPQLFLSCEEKLAWLPLSQLLRKKKDHPLLRTVTAAEVPKSVF